MTAHKIAGGIAATMFFATFGLVTWWLREAEFTNSSTRFLVTGTASAFYAICFYFLLQVLRRKKDGHPHQPPPP